MILPLTFMFTKNKHLPKMITSFGQHCGDDLPLLEKCWRNECSAHAYAKVTSNLLLKRVSNPTIRSLHQQARKARKSIRNQKLSATKKFAITYRHWRLPQWRNVHFSDEVACVWTTLMAGEDVGAEKENNTKKNALNEEVPMQEGHEVTLCMHFSWMWNGGWLLQMIIVGKWLIAKSWIFGI